jgi:hypothetical protein
MVRRRKAPSRTIRPNNQPTRPEAALAAIVANPENALCVAQPLARIIEQLKGEPSWLDRQLEFRVF